MARTYVIRSTQFLPVTLEQAWTFFCDPDNLRHITPPDMRFTVKNGPHTGKMYPGLIIEYSIRPLLGIPVYWMTEITQVAPLRYFIDEQRFGPYSFWHHQHHFESKDGGTEMTDIVHYRLPLGPLGTLAHRLFVRKRLEAIFDYRRKIVPSLL